MITILSRTFYSIGLWCDLYSLKWQVDIKENSIQLTLWLRWWGGHKDDWPNKSFFSKLCLEYWYCLLNSPKWIHKLQLEYNQNMSISLLFFFINEEVNDSLTLKMRKSWSIKPRTKPTVLRKYETRFLLRYHCKKCFSSLKVESAFERYFFLTFYGLSLFAESLH